MGNIILEELLNKAKEIAGRPTSMNIQKRENEDKLAKTIKKTFEVFAKQIVNDIEGWDSGKNATSSSFYPGGKNSNPYKRYLWHFFKPVNHPNQDLCLLVIYINLNPLKDNIFISIGIHDARNSDKYRKHLIGTQCVDDVYAFVDNEFQAINANTNFKRKNRELIYKKTLSNTSIEDFKNIFNDLIPIYESVVTKFPYLNEDLPCSIEYTGSEKRNIANSQRNENKCIDMQPLNQILYGPPGTGKTYKTINKALEIIENKTREELEQVDRNILNSRFKTYQKNGQIEFVTFHQSYGYEEFVEGIKPCNLEDCGGENDNIKYSVQSGVFKNLAKLASARYEFSENLHNIDFNKYLSVGQEFNTKHGKKFTVQKIDEDIYFEQAGNIHTALRKTILEVLSDEKVMTDDEYYSSQVYIAREIYKQLKREKKSAKNYILIIDEINRGNISKIFGELITLIEPSKRIGEDEALTLTLPYSKDEFGVPSNLYIIGTMNTADRSIAQIDTALRRRFVFEEMMPNTNLFTKNKNEITEESQYLERESDLKIQEHDINVRLMLNAINERIEYIHDREHTIGHSYFMELLKEGCNTKEKLDEIFKVSIIPLLAEYFYGDWGDIIEVLNDNNAHFIKNKTLKYKPKTDRKNKVYSINDKFSSKGYINIYNGLPTTEDSDKTK